MLDYTIRSCWECNSAHEHLKKTKLLCFACGKIYDFGIEVGKGEPMIDLMPELNITVGEGKPLIVEDLVMTLLENSED